MGSKWTVWECAAVALFPSAVALANSAPVVSNVTASQRRDGSKLVDIHYDLADALLAKSRVNKQALCP